MIRKSSIGMPYDFRRIGPNYFPDSQKQFSEGSALYNAHRLAEEDERGINTTYTASSNNFTVLEADADNSATGGTRPNPTAPRGLLRTCWTFNNAVSPPENFEHLAHIEDINSNERNFVAGKATGDPAIQKMFHMVERNAAERRLNSSRERPKPPPASTKPTLNSKFSYVSPATSKTVESVNHETDVAGSKVRLRGEDSFVKKKDLVNMFDDSSVINRGEGDRRGGYMMSARRSAIAESTAPDSGAFARQPPSENNLFNSEDVRLKQHPKEVILLPTKKKLENRLSEDSLKTPTPLSPFDPPFHTIPEYGRARSAYEAIVEIPDDSPVAPPRRKRTLERRSPGFYRKAEEKNDLNTSSKITQKASFTGEVNQTLQELDDLLDDQMQVGTSLGESNSEIHSDDGSQETKKTSVKDLVKKLGESNTDLMGMYRGNRWKPKESEDSTKVQTESDVQSPTEDEVVNDADIEALMSRKKAQIIGVNVFGIHNEKTFTEFIAQKRNRKAAAPLPPSSPSKGSPQTSSCSDVSSSSRPIAVLRSPYDNVEEEESNSRSNGMQSALAKSAPAETENFNQWKAKKISEGMREKLKRESIELEKFKKTNLEDALNEETQQRSKMLSDFSSIDPTVREPSMSSSERSLTEITNSERKLYRAVSGSYLNSEPTYVNLQQSKPCISKTKKSQDAVERTQSLFSKSRREESVLRKIPHYENISALNAERSTVYDSSPKEAQKEGPFTPNQEKEDEFRQKKSFAIPRPKSWLGSTLMDDASRISRPSKLYPVLSQYGGRAEDQNRDTINLDAEIRFSSSLLAKKMVKDDDLQGEVSVKTKKSPKGIDEDSKSRNRGSSKTSTNDASSSVPGNKNVVEDKGEGWVSRNEIKNIVYGVDRDRQEGSKGMHKRTTAIKSSMESICSDEASGKVMIEGNEISGTRSEEEKEDRLQSKKVEERTDFPQRISSGQRLRNEEASGPKTSIEKDRKNENKNLEKEGGLSSHANVPDKQIIRRETKKSLSQNDSKSANQKIAQKTSELAKKETDSSEALLPTTSKFQTSKSLGEAKANNNLLEESSSKGVQRASSISPRNWQASTLGDKSQSQTKAHSSKVALRRYATMQITMSSVESEGKSQRKSAGASEFGSLLHKNRDQQLKENKKEVKQEAAGVLTQSAIVLQKPTPMPRRRFANVNSTNESSQETQRRGEGTKQQRPTPPPRPSLQQRKPEMVNRSGTTAAKLSEDAEVDKCLRL